MGSPQPCEPPDINEVKLRILGGDPKASDAYYQSSTTSITRNTGSKSPEEFPKGVPRDVKVPGGMIALFEDQNKNRLKSATTMASSTSSPLPPFTDNESGNGKSKSGSGSKKSDGGSSSTGNHVEIDVDMTLPQSALAQKDDALVKSSSGTNEIICNGQKTNSSSSSTPINHFSVATAQSSITTGHHQHQNHQDQQHGAQPKQQGQQASPTKFPPSCEKDLEILKNVRKVYVQLTDDNMPCYYKVSDESQECLFETALGDTNGSIWSRYFKQQQKVILVHDRNQRGVLKLEFGRSRTISCCQTLRFAAMTASFKMKPEEPLCIIFKDKECCVSCCLSCCCPEATYETVPQLDSILPFSVFTKGRWKNRAELMVKHNDGTILGFIDKEQNSYSLTMGENLKPAMKACLIGFLIAMDVMDRQDAGKLSCYLRPTTILLISLLLMLCITIGGYLLHHFSSMLFSAKEDSILCGTFDEAGSRRTAPVPHFNNDRTSDSTASSGGTGGLSAAASAIMNASFTNEFLSDASSSSSSGTNIADNITGNNSSNWPV